MGRSVRVVIVGLASGLLVAGAWGADQVNNPQLSSTLSALAIAGMVGTGLLLAAIALGVPAGSRSPAQRRRQETADAAAVAEATATRIAELEARLAREEEELDAAVAALAAPEPAGMGQAGAGDAEGVPDAAAVALEPALRQEVVETFAELLGSAEPGQTAELVVQLEALFEKAG